MDRTTKLAVRQGFEPWVQLLSPYNGLANRRLQPLGHLTASRNLSINDIATYANASVPMIVPEIVPTNIQKRPQNRAWRMIESAFPNAAVLFCDNHSGN